MEIAIPEPPEPAPQTVAGRALKCPVCQNDRFTVSRRILPSRGAALFDMEWINRGATIYICSDCDHLLWFAHSSESDVTLASLLA